MAVDVSGSVALGGRPQAYKMTGLGLSFAPPNFDPSTVWAGYQVPDEISFNTCMLLARREGLAEGCLRKTGLACTISSVVNYNILPKKHLKNILGLIDGHTVVGVNSAHTGTVLGLLFDSRKIHDAAILQIVQRLCGRHNIVGVHNIISGSCFRKSSEAAKRSEHTC